MRHTALRRPTRLDEHDGAILFLGMPKRSSPYGGRQRGTSGRTRGQRSHGHQLTTIAMDVSVEPWSRRSLSDHRHTVAA